MRDATRIAEAVARRSRAKASRFPEDDLLRRYGFVIVRRRRGLPVLWRMLGEILTHAEAIAWARKFEDDDRCEGK